MHFWEAAGRKTCANRVQERRLCKLCANQTRLGICANLCKDFGPPWSFVIGQPSQILGMSLRVLSSKTPDDPNSWSYLLGGGHMTRLPDGVNWGIYTTNLPIGAAVSFRVIASAQDYVDLVSALLGPFQIGFPLPVNSTTISTGGTRTVQDFLGIGGAFMNSIHVVGVTVHLIPADNTTTTQGW